MFLNRKENERAELVSDRSFNRNLHSMVSTYLRIKGEKGPGKSRQFYPVPYGGSRHKEKRTAIQ